MGVGNAPFGLASASAHALHAASPPQVAPPSPVEVGVGKVLEALANLLAPLTFAGFGVYFMQSDLVMLLRSSDVLGAAGLGVAAWATSRYLDSVAKRFDAMDRRFDAIDKALKGRLQRLLLSAEQHSR